MQPLSSWKPIELVNTATVVADALNATTFVVKGMNDDQPVAYEHLKVILPAMAAVRCVFDIVIMCLDMTSERKAHNDGNWLYITKEVDVSVPPLVKAAKGAPPPTGPAVKKRKVTRR